MKKIMLLLIFIPFLLRSEQFYKKLIPDSFVSQFAGNQGVMSAGFGYFYEIYKKERTTKIMYGFYPECLAGTDIHIISLKKGTCFYQKKTDKFTVKGSVNLTAIMSLTDNTYIFWPDHYPEGYYPSNAFHMQPSVSISTQINTDSGSEFNNISIYSELGILDHHLHHIIKTGRINILDTINISLGLVHTFNNIDIDTDGRE